MYNITVRLTAFPTVRLRKLKGEGWASPCWTSKFLKLIVFPSSRAGVPVWRRPSLNPAE